jgi:ankyrin repeat protein
MSSPASPRRASSRAYSEKDKIWRYAKKLKIEKFMKELKNPSVDIEAQDDNGMTALLWAATKGNLDMVTALLEHSPPANIEPKNSHGWSILMVSAFKAHPHIVEYLIKKGCRVSDRNDEGKTVLMCAAGYVPNNRDKTTEDSVNTDDAVDEHGNPIDNPLDSVWDRKNPKIGTRDLETFNLLIDAKADVNAVSSSEYSHGPLMWTVSVGNVEASELLLNAGTNIEQKTNDGMNALHMASQRLHPRVVSLLIKRGANLEAADLHGLTAVAWVCRRQPLEEKNGESATARLARETARGRQVVRILDLLHQNGANMDHADVDGKTGLMWALETNNTAAVERLVQADLQVNLEAVNSAGKSVLEVATAASEEFSNNTLKVMVEEAIATREAPSMCEGCVIA